MENLPDEVMLMIFEHLPSRALAAAAEVCRRWNALLRRRVVEVQRQDDVKRLHRGVIALHVSGCLDSLRACLANVIDVAPHLRQLTIQATNSFGDETIAALHRLRHLDHLDVFIRNRRIEMGLLPVLMRLNSLVINETVTPGVLRALAKSERVRCIHMFGRSLYYPQRELLAVLRARQHHLTELTLRCTELTDVAYDAIGQCSNLTSLQLYSCWLMTGAGALHTTRLLKLRRLHITGARMVRTRALSVFIDQLPPHVEELCLSATWFGDDHALPLARRLPGLKVLELWRCRLTSCNILEMARALPTLYSLDLDISLTDIELLLLSDHPTITDIRCLTERRFSLYSDEARDSYSIVMEGSQGAGGRRVVRVSSAQARLARKYVRGGGEGYRATLFYYWTQDRELDPLPLKQPPGFDLDDDDFADD
ncbi:F-box/LRR-repeat protein 7-like [Galleria mellonella]|uniref:F-box/LRR-repeat protein 7-like n=1 Tax=Galleria mellonella TaxID=7137 RepID=A0A6J1WBK4_GALME|nr:F-box/LRR-repeat protein 7-like [Galleria mellonella]